MSGTAYCLHQCVRRRLPLCGEQAAALGRAEQACGLREGFAGAVPGVRSDERDGEEQLWEERALGRE